MLRPKLLIYKKVVLDSKGHFRFYTVERHNGKSTVFDLCSEPSKYPNISYIQTEKQLCKFIYECWGSGEFLIKGFIKGSHGSWIFWRGDIDERGFVFQFKGSNINKDIEKLKNEMNATQDVWEKENLEMSIEIEKQIKKGIKYGFYPYLKSSGRRGQFISWEDPDYFDNKFNEIDNNNFDNSFYIEDISFNNKNNINNNSIW